MVYSRIFVFLEAMQLLLPNVDHPEDDLRVA